MVSLSIDEMDCQVRLMKYCVLERRGAEPEEERRCQILNWSSLVLVDERRQCKEDQKQISARSGRETTLSVQPSSLIVDKVVGALDN